MSNPTDAFTLAEFTRRLHTLRKECGEPSFRAISEYAARTNRRISQPTISNLLGGERLTRVETVEAFVRTLLYVRDRRVQPGHEQVVAQWLRWRSNVRISSTAPSTDRVPAVPRPFAPSSRSTAPPVHSDPASYTRGLSLLLAEALRSRDEHGRVWGQACYGCYAFFDHDGEPVYVGQTCERLDIQIRRHLTDRRGITTTRRVLDAGEVAAMELWPVWDDVASRVDHDRMQRHLDDVERTVYLTMLDRTRFGALLSETVPSDGPTVTLPPSRRFELVDDTMGHPYHDVAIRIERGAANLARLASMVATRDDIALGIRRVMALQAARLTRLAARQYSREGGLPSAEVAVTGLNARPRR